jgi:23S rRNA-/tRNA-specific pseudouridylate synthase
MDQRPIPAILDQDDDWIALAKPSGWVCHPAGTDAPDLLAWLVAHHGPGWAPAHRLDRGTSGVVVYARPTQVDTIARAFATGPVEKRYTALVYGATRPHGTIDRPLQDGRRGRALPATTRWRRREAFGRWTLLDIRPETGRKHQIRRHLQGIGHAIVGDDRYRPRGNRTVPAFPGRLWLHAAHLALPGLPPLDAPLPDELLAHLERVRQVTESRSGKRPPRP